MHRRSRDRRDYAGRASRRLHGSGWWHDLIPDQVELCFLKGCVRFGHYRETRHSRQQLWSGTGQIVRPPAQVSSGRSWSTPLDQRPCRGSRQSCRFRASRLAHIFEPFEQASSDRRARHVDHSSGYAGTTGLADRGTRPRPHYQLASVPCSIPISAARHRGLVSDAPPMIDARRGGWCSCSRSAVPISHR